MTALQRVQAVGMVILVLMGLGPSAMGFQSQSQPVLGFIQPFKAQYDLPTQGEEEPLIEKSFSVKGAGLLRVFTPSGNIKVTGVPDTNAVVVRLYVRRGYALWSGSKSLDNFRITHMQRGNEITASVEIKSRESKIWSGSDVSFHYEIRAPQEFSTEMQSLGGDIIIGNMTGRHLAKTNGGSLKLENIKGELKGFTAGGHIELAECQGVVKAQTYGGNIQMRKVQGEVRTYSSGGNIEGKDMEGTFFARTTGGNIQADMNYIDQGLNLESNAGNVRAQIPKNQGYEVVLKGMSVNFDDSYSFVGQRTNRYIAGQVGDGGPTINMTANVGTVTLVLSGMTSKHGKEVQHTRESDFDLDFDWD